VQWPATASPSRRSRFFADGRFFTADRRANFIAVAPPRLAEATTSATPLILNTGRVRDQWHTMTRTGLSPRLGSHVVEPFVSIHPADAACHGVTDGGLAKVSNRHGSAIYRAVVTPAQARGALFAPIHWNDETASNARTGTLVHAIVDPYSGQPDCKATPVAIAPVAVRFSGFILSRQRITLPRDATWAWSAVAGGYVTKLDLADDGGNCLDALAQSVGGDVDVLRYENSHRRIRRIAFLHNDRLVAAFFLAPTGQAPAWTGLAEAWASETIPRTHRKILLSGKRLDGGADEGPNVCACFGVPRNRIVAAIAAGSGTPAALGAKLKAGTNCGSCIPELKRLLADAQAKDFTAPQIGVS
jgi:assimilatory nitrate reductase catalytic subunit